jgi:hypothetical protein
VNVIAPVIVDVHVNVIAPVIVDVIVIVDVDVDVDVDVIVDVDGRRYGSASSRQNLCSRSLTPAAGGGVAAVAGAAFPAGSLP